LLSDSNKLVILLFNETYGDGDLINLTIIGNMVGIFNNVVNNVVEKL